MDEWEEGYKMGFKSGLIVGRRLTKPRWPLISLGIVVLVIVSLGIVGTAKADKPVGLTCGGSITSLSAFYDVSTHTWYEGDTHNCGYQKTYSWEVQYTVNGTDWYDWSPEHLIASGNCNTGCAFHGKDIGALCSSNAARYRIRGWWADGRITTQTRTGVNACAGYTMST